MGILIIVLAVAVIIGTATFCAAVTKRNTIERLERLMNDNYQLQQSAEKIIYRAQCLHDYDLLVKWQKTRDELTSDMKTLQRNYYHLTGREYSPKLH